MNKIMGVFTLLLSATSWACDNCGNYLNCIYQSNRLPNIYDYNKPQPRLRTKPDGTYEYQQPGETLHYNTFDNNYSFESPKARLRRLPDGTYQWVE